MIELVYLGAAVCFILGLKLLSSPRSAPRGNLIAALGMLVAVVATLLQSEQFSWSLILWGLGVGIVIGTVAAVKVQMTAMPQMVAIFNGLGGGASAFVASSHLAGVATTPALDVTISVALSMFIGAVTLTGSLIAFGKLQGIVNSRPVTYLLQKTINFSLLAVAVGLGVWLSMSPLSSAVLILLAAVSVAIGVLIVLPIGGGDMPVVICLLNSYSGLAACATGFVLKNNVLIISGALVGASGVILTYIMCKAMNRSLLNVLFGAFGKIAEPAGPEGAPAGDGKAVRSYSPDDIALIFSTANSVVIVPGYGMAVAQAQHAVRELADLLADRGVDVKYAIHPVAGRMPGHMNVLLAEADVPYEQLYELDDINPAFPETDVALVVGANDVTNPAARSDRSSPIYGMPILDVDKARSVIVCKRSLRPGFAGVDNELYTMDNTVMLFGDAKKSLTELAFAVKEL